MNIFVSGIWWKPTSQPSRPRARENSPSHMCLYSRRGLRGGNITFLNARGFHPRWITSTSHWKLMLRESKDAQRQSCRKVNGTKSSFVRFSFCRFLSLYFYTTEGRKMLFSGASIFERTFAWMKTRFFVIRKTELELFQIVLMQKTNKAKATIIFEQNENWQRRFL